MIKICNNIMRTKKILELTLKHVFDNHVIYIISKYLKKKWSIDTTDFKKYKVKCTQKSKKKHSFSYHYYYH